MAVDFINAKHHQHFRQKHSKLRTTFLLDPESIIYNVYAISSLTRNYIYVGITGNIERRLNQHNKGCNRTTKPYKPFELIYSEKCENRVEEARPKLLGNIKQMINSDRKERIFS